MPRVTIRHFLKKHTKEGDKVFDPFSGLGSTLYVAESLGRIPFGIEADPKRFRWIQKNLSDPNRVVQGDSAQLAKYGFPKFDFAFTSPPYMPKHHQWNPLCPSDLEKRGYTNYLNQMKLIFKQVSSVMKRGSYVIIQADNLTGKQYTPLAWDIASVVSEVMRFDGETVVAWQGSRKGEFGHSYCFTFKKTT